MRHHTLKEVFPIALLQIGPFPESFKIRLEISMIPLEYTSLEVDFALFLQIIVSVPGDIIIGPVNLVLEVLSQVVYMLPLVEIVALC